MSMYIGLWLAAWVLCSPLLAQGGPSIPWAWWTCSSPCSRCLRRAAPMEKLIQQLYPGLFSETPPQVTFPDKPTAPKPVKTSPPKRDANSLVPQSSSSDYSSYAKKIGRKLLESPSAEIPYGPFFNYSSVQPVRHGWYLPYRSRDVNTPVWNIRAQRWERERRGPYRPPRLYCCETKIDYITPPTVEVSGSVYRVVHLSNAFQFVPVGECKQNTRCSTGECTEAYRIHYVLVYNQTSTGGPPVSFAAINVPSHCHCVNTARSQQKRSNLNFFGG